jgi:hypothetical protein
VVDSTIQRFNDLTLSSDLIGDIRGSKNNKSVDTPRAYQLKNSAPAQNLGKNKEIMPTRFNRFN